ncbi:MAG: hypothetical protein ACFB10_19465 [Salibacteraceae bacterium]
MKPYDCASINTHPQLNPMKGPTLPTDHQDRTSEAWRKLCAYIDALAASGDDEFTPREALGDALFAQIYTLPASIAQLKRVKKVGLYGSRLQWLPPEIGEMESLEYFDPYTSYDLHWFPYEITRCKHLKDSRISTRALFGNFKHRSPFPSLAGNPVRYHSQNLKCSVCDTPISYAQTDQYWISLLIGTDVVPLLANVCSTSCKSRLPTPHEKYVQEPHKGGPDLQQPPDAEQEWVEIKKRLDRGEDVPGVIRIKAGEQKQGKKLGELPSLKLIRKIWEK